MLSHIPNLLHEKVSEVHFLVEEQVDSFDATTSITIHTTGFCVCINQSDE